MKSPVTVTTIWVTLQTDGFKHPFSNGKDLPVLTARTFNLDKKTAEVVANLAGIDILTIAYENSSRVGEGGIE